VRIGWVSFIGLSRRREHVPNPGRSPGPWCRSSPSWLFSSPSSGSGRRAFPPEACTSRHQSHAESGRSARLATECRPCRHRRWSGDGTWRSVLDELRVDCDTVDGGQWCLSVDGTVIHAHHHSAGARHEPPKDIAAEVLAPTVLDNALRQSKHTGGCVELHENWRPAGARCGPRGVGA